MCLIVPDIARIQGQSEEVCYLIMQSDFSPGHRMELILWNTVAQPKQVNEDSFSDILRFR